jgi:hypothetical protein
MNMTKRTQSKLNHPKGYLIQQALFSGCWDESENLLLRLYLAQRADKSSRVLTKSCEDYLVSATEAAALVHDYSVLMGLPGHYIGVIDRLIGIDDKYAPHREQALALVAEAAPRHAEAAVPLPDGKMIAVRPGNVERAV